jgi:chromosome partitioning protein
MGNVITVMNMKGGVGKTTVTMHLAGIFARHQIGGRFRNVLMIDYDPQFNLSQAFIPPKTYFSLEKQRRTGLSILQDDEVDLNPFQIQVGGNLRPPELSDLVHSVYKLKHSRLDIVPSTLNLMYVALGQSEKRTAPLEERFEKFIGQCREEYDLVFIDCHPAGSILTKTSLQNSDHVIIPVSPQRYATRGIWLMMRFIEAKKPGTTGPTPHILFNSAPRFGRSRDEREIRADPKWAKRCMTTTMKWYTAFSEPLDGDGFVWSSNRPYSKEATRNLLSLAAELAERMDDKDET